MGILSEAKYQYRFRYYNLSVEQAVGLILPTLNSLTWAFVNIEIDDNPNGTAITAKTNFSWKSFGEYVIITVEDSNYILVNSSSEYVGIDWGKNKQNCSNFEKTFNEISKDYSKDSLEVLFNAFKEAKENSEMIEI